jgi:hypothetical protein
MAGRGSFVCSKPPSPSCHCNPTTPPLAGCSSASALTSVSVQPDQQLQPNGRRVIRLDSENCRNDGVTDHEDHKIRWKIVGAVMKQFFAAFLTMIGNPQEAAEQFALPAVWAPHRKAPPHGFGWRDKLSLRDGHDKPSFLTDPYNMEKMSNNQKQIRKLHGLAPYIV